jgi:flagellar hook-associated protein 2
LNDKISEKIQYDYEPLTDEQKEEMTESEIEKWEEMAKSGLMRNDRQISGLLSDMRSAIYEKVEGVVRVYLILVLKPEVGQIRVN